MGASITSAWGGLFTAPFTAVLINVELSIDRTVMRGARLTADATAALVGFALFYLIDAGWSDVLRLLDLPGFEFEMWNLFLGAGLGVVAAVIGTLFKLSTLATRKLAVPLADYPLIRCTLFGLVFGLVAMALPLTLFLGTQGLADVADEPATLGAGLILASVAVKLIATTGALSFGFVGGPVFPLLFIGGGLGAVLHLAVNDIPLALAMTAMMAAVPAAVIPIPLGLATFVVLLSGIGATESTSVFVAAVISIMTSKAIEAKLPKPPPATDEGGTHS
jgi:H+/Cl- antiporter ClcA